MPLMTTGGRTSGHRGLLYFAAVGAAAKELRYFADFQNDEQQNVKQKNVERQNV
jgi:hypothetical protein